MGGKGKTVVCKPGDFERENHFYQRALNAQIHPLVSYFLSLSQDVLITRFCHLNPTCNKEILTKILNQKPNHFRWAGSDLFHVTTVEGHRQTVVIETNSCPSGQKSMPLHKEDEEQGGYLSLLMRTIKPYIEEKEKDLPEGGLAVIFDKNIMEASGYANTLTDVFNEEVYLVEWYINDDDPPARFNSDKVLEIRKQDGTWVPIRAAFRYVTQKPWNRIIVGDTKTIIINPLAACLAGGRNKALAAKAYDFYNAELQSLDAGICIRTPETIRDVSKAEIPLYVSSFGGHAVVKVPYSNAGQGVYTITNKKELDEFMEIEDCPYDNYIVQSLIGNYSWSSVQRTGQYYHVGTIPNKKCKTYASDLRMMIHYDFMAGCYRPLVIYARKAAKPLEEKLTDNCDSWAILGTNLSVLKEDGTWDTETARLLLMDRRDFNQLGISVDTLIDGYIQTVLSVIAIDNMASNLVSPDTGVFNIDLFTSLNRDEGLIGELKLE